jgi:hypothetical protein
VKSTKGEPGTEREQGDFRELLQGIQVYSDRKKLKKKKERKL